ncbi:MAG: polysaccharide deacetylase family protein [Gammaproteobacteria bacterium]|nr:polysaccharide deacetylase family protein [Gammaproteobacteria bacterium]
MATIITSVKHLVKRILQIFAARFGRHTRQPGQPELLLLMYHRILPADDPRALLEEPGMMVSPETFRLHMSLIKPLFKTMHLSHWLELKNSGKNLPERACAVTFDDGWVDNYEFAYPILKELGIPATIFLVSDMIGKTRTFWPERLSSLVNEISKQPEKWSHESLRWIRQLPVSYPFDENNTKRPDREQFSEIIGAAKSLSDEELNHRLDIIEDQLQLSCEQDNVALLNWQQVEEMCQSEIIEVGSHTCNHTRLTEEQQATTLAHEIADSKQVIEDRTGRAVKTFCYPNGDYSAAAKTLVEQHYIGAVTTKSGWNTATSNPYLLQRMGVHEDISSDKTSFLARISGWL